MIQKDLINLGLTIREITKLSMKKMQRLKNNKESSLKFILQTYRKRQLCSLTGVNNAAQVPLVSVLSMHATNWECGGDFAVNISHRQGKLPDLGYMIGILILQGYT